MRESRRCVLGYLLLVLVTFVLFGLSNIPLVHADAVEDFNGEAEAAVDATGDVQIEEPESPTEDTDRSASSTSQEGLAEAAAQAQAAAQAEAAAAAAKAKAEEAAAKAKAEAEAAAKAAAEAVEEAEEAKVSLLGDIGASAKSKAITFVDRAKDITPDKMKKVAAGALGIWGVAAGAGWVMNNLGGVEE